MKLIRTVAEMAALARDHGPARPAVLVPSMGALHAGHLSLVDAARARAGADGEVVVSIFVNPTQFGPKEDFSRYPRPLERDLELCRERGVDTVFQPEPADVYPAGNSVIVDESLLTKRLCGQSRPSHFRGVCTVVTKLFNIIRPTAAVFGMKDYQQLAIIRQMVRDLNFPLEIIPGETVREPDGLALSSRNVYLSPDERAQAPVLRRALLDAARAASEGEADPAALRHAIVGAIKRDAPLSSVDYVEVAAADTLAPVEEAQPGRTVIAVAVFFGRTRLIDNILL